MSGIEIGVTGEGLASFSLSCISVSPRLFACSICISPVWPGVETGTGPGRSGLPSVALLDSLPVRKQASLLDWNRLFGADLRERCCHIDQSTALRLCPHRVAILTIITSPLLRAWIWPFSLAGLVTPGSIIQVTEQFGGNRSYQVGSLWPIFPCQPKSRT